jgi:hypothetical protein
MPRVTVELSLPILPIHSQSAWSLALCGAHSVASSPQSSFAPRRSHQRIQTRSSKSPPTSHDCRFMGENWRKPRSSLSHNDVHVLVKFGASRLLPHRICHKSGWAIGKKKQSHNCFASMCWVGCVGCCAVAIVIGLCLCSVKW